MRSANNPEYSGSRVLEKSMISDLQCGGAGPFNSSASDVASWLVRTLWAMIGIFGNGE